MASLVFICYRGSLDVLKIILLSFIAKLPDVRQFDFFVIREVLRASFILRARGFKVSASQ